MLRPMIAAGALALVLSASQAAAQTTTPEAMAKAHAFADGKIKAVQAGDLFEVVDYKGIPTARHLRSGLRCHFLGDADLIHIVPSKLPRGDDVGCSMHVNGFTETFYATRFPGSVTEDQAMATYQNEVTQVHPDAKLLEGADHDVKLPPQLMARFPEIRTERYEINFQGKPTYSRLSVAVVNGWVLEQRLTGPIEQADEGDRMGSTDMLRNVNWMHGGDLMPE